jgi:hypothetical protein
LAESGRTGLAARRTAGGNVDAGPRRRDGHLVADSAICAKRLHDLNLSGWWMLVLPLITMIETAARIDP